MWGAGEIEGWFSKTLLDAFDGDIAPIDPGANTLEFIRQYRLTADGHPIDLSNRYRHLVELYEDNHNDITVMAAAQTGKSVWEMADLARNMVVHWGQGFAWWFPDFHLPDAFSKTRFAPFIRSSDVLGKLLGSTTRKGDGSDAVRLRTLGPSTVFFLSVAGRTSTEGLPILGNYFDELRRMSRGDVQRALERASGQENPIVRRVSTARYPESDIHAAFLAGDQRYFHTACQCPNGIVLSKAWPECVVDLKSASLEMRRKVEHAFAMAGMPYLNMTEEQIHRWGEAVYACPKCGTILVDPRDGWWESHAPELYGHSYQMPQLLSWTYPASRAWSKWNDPEAEIQELWNSLLGLPYLDKTAQPVQPEHLAACVNAEAKWAGAMSEDWRRKHCKGTAMGIDAMGGYLVCVIKQRTLNGKHRTIHLEIPHGEDPWIRADKLMKQYDVSVCVADCNPHWNEAHRFANRHPGRVWLSVYIDTPTAKVVEWMDRAKMPAGQKGETKFKHMVRIHRTRGLQWSLGRWSTRNNETPPPSGLVQMLPRQAGKVILTAGLKVGNFEPVPICRDVYWLHLQRVVFAKQEIGEDAKRRGEIKIQAEHVGLDPHFAHADLYASVALARVMQASAARFV